MRVRITTALVVFDAWIIGSKSPVEASGSTGDGNIDLSRVNLGEINGMKSTINQELGKTTDNYRDREGKPDHKGGRDSSSAGKARGFSGKGLALGGESRAMHLRARIGGHKFSPVRR